VTRLLTIAVLAAAGALLAGTATGLLSGARASVAVAMPKDGSVIAWGCGRVDDNGQCRVPAAARHGVTAIAASYYSLALTNDGAVVGWGCLRGPNSEQCHVPAAARHGVTAIAVGSEHSLALLKDGSVIAWGCGGRHDHRAYSLLPAAGRHVVSEQPRGGHD